MDTAGSNRYELLYMDDDNSIAAPVVESKKKKPPSTTHVVKIPPISTNKGEKENKTSSLNKNDQKNVTGPVQGSKPKQETREVFNKANNDHGNSERNLTNNGGRGERNIRQIREKGGENLNENQQRPARQFRDRDDRGPPRSRFGEGGFRGGKREFDRQSGSDKTGVKAVDKRDGAGAHNWGSVKQDIEDVNKSNTENETVLTDKEESGNEQVTTEGGTNLEEEETKEMTLDEWKAMKKQREKPQFNIRKPGEGEDTTQWKKMIALNKKKKKEGANSDEEELEYDPSMYPQRVGRLQRIVDIEFNFNDNRRAGGNFRGGRGRGRGPRPNVGDKGQPENEDSQLKSNMTNQQRNNKQKRAGAKPLMVDDENQFPTLN